jgi:putative transposase
MKAYKYKIRRPSRRVVEQFEQTLDVCRELYNAALQERRDAWRIERKSVSCYDQIKQLPEIKLIRDDLAVVHSQVQRDPLMRTDKAFQAFFRRVKVGQKAGYPRFKSIKRYDSFTYPQKGFTLEDNKLTLSKIGSVRLRLSRPVEGKIKTCTIKRGVDGWYVIFTIEENQCPYFPKTDKSVGVDVGIERFATLSTGEAIANPQYLRQAEKALKTAQRRVSRRKKGSNRRRKAVQLLAKKHLKITRQRQDFFHKLSLRLVKEFDEIVFEDLNIAGMMKNHHLAKSISDAAWGIFISIHEGKAASAGRRVVKVPAQFTSQDCSACGARVRKSLAVREHRCIACGLVLHRDHNAAINIKGRADLSGMMKVTSSREPRISGYIENAKSHIVPNA